MSIKNKLVTAVTTAGLLAGLFGSAFVPVARGAAGGATAAISNTSNEDYAGASVYYFSAAVLPEVKYVITTDGDEDGTYDLSEDGGAIRACTVAVANGPAAAVGATTTSSCAVAVTDDAGNGGTVTVTMNLQKIAADSSVTVTLADPAGTNLIAAGVKTLTGVAATALSDKLSVSKSAAAIKVDYDADGTGGQAGDVGDTTIGGVEYIATSQDLGSAAVFVGVLKNGYDVALGTDTTIVASVTGSNYVVCDENVNQTFAAGSISVNALTVTDAAADFECKVTSADGAEGQGGAWTLTISTVTNTVIDTFSAGFLGEIATVAVSTDYDRVATDLAGSDTDYFTVTVSDASGRAYAAADLDDGDIIETNVATAFKVWDGADANKADIAATTLVDADGDGLMDLENTVCADGDGPAAGVFETRSAQFLYEDGAGATITSNTVTFSCGIDKDTALVVEKLEFAASTVVPGGSLKAKVYLADANGDDASPDDVQANVPLVLTNGLNTDLLVGNPADGDIDTCTIVEGGYCEITITAPTTVGTTISLYSAAPTNGALIRAYVSSDAYEAVLTVGPKKLKATADFGPAAGKKKIAFVLESASGSTKTFYRRANASGVATYTLNLRGTWTVYATFGDEISDTGTMRK